MGDGTSKCKRIYEKDDGEWVNHPRQCKSGARNSEGFCATVENMKYKGQTLSYPYVCSPDTNYECEMYDNSWKRVYYDGY